MVEKDVKNKCLGWGLVVLIGELVMEQVEFVEKIVWDSCWVLIEYLELNFCNLCKMFMEKDLVDLLEFLKVKGIV